MNTPDETLQARTPYTSLPSFLPFPIVGLGASAGGLAALLRFFEQMPNESGMAFVVVMHLSAEHESSADRILQKVTRMPCNRSPSRHRWSATMST